MIVELLAELRTAAEEAQHTARVALAETNPERRRALIDKAEAHARAAARKAWRAAEALVGERA